MLQSPEVISINKGMNRYSDYVLCDTDSIELNQKAMVTVQGAALYNNIINNNVKYKKKYGTLFDADKLCVIYIKPGKKYTYWKKETSVPVSLYQKSPDLYRVYGNPKSVNGVMCYTDAMSLQSCEAFSYPAGMYPMDLTENMEIDKTRMFKILILAPINRIIEAMGYPEIDTSVTCTKGFW